MNPTHLSLVLGFQPQPSLDAAPRLQEGLPLSSVRQVADEYAGGVHAHEQHGLSRDLETRRDTRRSDLPSHTLPLKSDATDATASDVRKETHWPVITVMTCSQKPIAIFSSGLLRHTREGNQEQHVSFL